MRAGDTLSAAVAASLSRTATMAWSTPVRGIRCTIVPTTTSTERLSQ